MVRRKQVIILAPCTLCIGCSRAPSISVVGSFFPVWMLCLLIGTVLTFVARILLVRSRLETEVGPLALFYPSLLTLCACLLWLIFFR
ncbi:YtcA family lipoprotein [Bryocella elongata]|nr:YtcA family lipoprotein [Bryocella elongata]